MYQLSRFIPPKTECLYKKNKGFSVKNKKKEKKTPTYNKRESFRATGYR